MPEWLIGINSLDIILVVGTPISMTCILILAIAKYQEGGGQ